MTRIARCCCGSLRAEVTGEPWIVAICHCTECQRRTGSAFGASAHFPMEQVRIEGPSKVYVRASDSGRKVEFHFCPDCGTSVFWYAEVRPDHIPPGSTSSGRMHKFFNRSCLNRVHGNKTKSSFAKGPRWTLSEIRTPR